MGTVIQLITYFVIGMVVIGIGGIIVTIFNSIINLFKRKAK